MHGAEMFVGTRKNREKRRNWYIKWLETFVSLDLLCSVGYVRLQ